MRASTILRNLTLVASIALSCSCTKNSSQRANEIAAEHLKELSSEVRLHPADEGALRELIATMDDTNKTAFERQYACTELGSLGALARDSIPALVKALNSTDRVLEREAAIALGNVGVGIDDAVDPLRDKLSQSNTDTAWFAAESLGKIGAPALKALPDLRRVAESSNRIASGYAKEAISKLEQIRIQIDTKHGSH